MRVVIRVDHGAVSGSGEIEHRLSAPDAMVIPMQSALAAADWPAQVPAVLAICRGRDGAPRMSTASTFKHRGEWTPTDPMLVSFVIA